MTTDEPENKNENVCNLKYLSDMMGGKKQIIISLIDTFLIQAPEELQSINDAIIKTNYAVIRKTAHTMRSDVSMMGISILAPLLKEMEDLGAGETGIEKIKELNNKLNLICKQAFEELEKEKLR